MIKRKVILAGELGKKYGRVHHFAISTPGEAIRALVANFTEFNSDLIHSADRGVGYKVIVDKDPVSDAEKSFHNPFSKTVRIIPVIMGAKSGIFNVILGAAIIAAAFWTGGASLGATGGLTFASVGAQVGFSIGVSLALSGVSQMLAPQMKAGDPRESPENQPSYTFNGPVNTTAQGQCVPVGYGRLIVGSAVVSAGLTSDQYSNGVLV